MAMLVGLPENVLEENEELYPVYIIPPVFHAHVSPRE
jgi:hypothetical protein